jgi:putative aldouronate transport system permease protein
MIENTGASRITFVIFNYIFMITLGVVCIVPIWHVLMASVSNPRMLFASSGIRWVPAGEMTFRGYALVFRNSSILRGYVNTLVYVAATTVMGTALTAVGGFVLSRPHLTLARPLSLFVIFTMMFSGGLIPSYMINRALGLVGNPLAVIIPCLTNGFFILIMRSAFAQLPSSYEESAKLDGAGPVVIMARILVPLVQATIAVVVMNTVILNWNSWFQASVYLARRRDLWPLQLFMREILVQNDTARIITGSDAAKAADNVANLVKYCVTIIGTVPVLCSYPFAQKYFVRGVTLGGIKG